MLIRSDEKYWVLSFINCERSDNSRTRNKPQRNK